MSLRLNLALTVLSFIAMNVAFIGTARAVKSESRVGATWIGGLLVAGKKSRPLLTCQPAGIVCVNDYECCSRSCDRSQNRCN